MRLPIKSTVPPEIKRACMCLCFSMRESASNIKLHRGLGNHFGIAEGSASEGTSHSPGKRSGPGGPRGCQQEQGQADSGSRGGSCWPVS